MPAPSRSPETEEKNPMCAFALRAQNYRVLAVLLRRAVAQEQLAQLRGLAVDQAPKSDLSVAWQLLKQAAERYDSDAISREYFDVFIGVGRGELVPFGSWYMTGFLMEKPLALLRSDLADLGIERDVDERESEDHIANLCDAMALLLENPDQFSETRNQAFFDAHLAPWTERFFADLQEAKSAHFYRAVGHLGEAFMRFEKQYQQMTV